MTDLAASTLRDRLNALERRARRHIGGWQRARDHRRGFRRAWVWAPVGPVAAAAFHLVRVVSGVGSVAWSWWVWPLLFLAGPLAVFVVDVVRASRARRLSRRECLGAFDLQLATNDRLVTADEFLALDPTAGTTSFHKAAIEDAAEHVASAEHVSLDSRPLPALALTRRAAGAVLAALLVTAATYWLSWQAVSPTSDGTAADAVSGEPAATPARLLASWLGRLPEARRADRPPAAAPDTASSTAATPETSPRMNQAAEDAAGGSQSGGQARSRSTSQAMSSAGSPSNQKTPSEPMADDPPQDQPASKAAPPKRPDGRKAEPQAASATSGQGQSRSSSVDRSAIPAVDQPDRAGANKDDGKDEEGAQDEVEEEKTSGAERPSLRRNKPPVDRNLSPRPAGDEPNPNANGRSGPGGRKKTRGVPAMILGIPTPDRIQGMTHPGRSKVTQENATPREEPQAAADAEARGPRQAPMGHVEHPRLAPWMQSLIEKYFLRGRPPATTGSGGPK